MPKPICVACARFYKPFKLGVTVLEQMPKHSSGVKPGNDQHYDWQPYKVWHADVYRCDGCFDEIVVGFGMRPIWERHHETEMPPPDVIVNDC